MHYYPTRLLAHGIIANAVAPALVATDMVKRIAPPPPSSRPRGRCGRAEELALPVRTLAQCE